MAAPLRSIATLSISFGLVSIPVRVYLATERAAAIRFKLVTREGHAVRRPYVAETSVAETSVAETSPEPPQWAPIDDPAPTRPVSSQAATPALSLVAGSRYQPAVAAASAAAAVAEPDDLSTDEVPPQRGPQPLAAAEVFRAYEVDRDRVVLFSDAELAALSTPPRDTIDIVAFVPLGSVDPVYVDKAYYLAPAERGARPYALLLRALQRLQRCAIARWAWRGREHLAMIRPGDGGLVLQQLHHGDEVRPIGRLGIEPVEPTAAELALAEQLIERSSEPAYDPSRYVGAQKQRILDAVQRKIEGRDVIERPSARAATAPTSGEVTDLLAALRASLQAPASAPASAPARKPARRAPSATSKPATARDADPVPRRGRRKRGRAHGARLNPRLMQR